MDDLPQHSKGVAYTEAFFSTPGGVWLLAGLLLSIILLAGFLLLRRRWEVWSPSLLSGDWHALLDLASTMPDPPVAPDEYGLTFAARLRDTEGFGRVRVLLYRTESGAVEIVENGATGGTESINDADRGLLLSIREITLRDDIADSLRISDERKHILEFLDRGGGDFLFPLMVQADHVGWVLLSGGGPWLGPGSLKFACLRRVLHEFALTLWFLGRPASVEPFAVSLPLNERNEGFDGSLLVDKPGHPCRIRLRPGAAVEEISPFLSDHLGHPSRITFGRIISVLQRPFSGFDVAPNHAPGYGSGVCARRDRKRRAGIQSLNERKHDP